MQRVGEESTRGIRIPGKSTSSSVYIGFFARREYATRIRFPCLAESTELHGQVSFRYLSLSSAFMHPILVTVNRYKLTFPPDVLLTF